MTKKSESVSIILPCLNEEKSIGTCVTWAKKGLKAIRKTFRIDGEIIVVDNGSTDKSAQLAQKAGAIVYHEKKRGYGQAYLTGIQKTKGTYILIGDSDATYDFRAIVPFIAKLKEGSDLVLGNRFAYESSRSAIPFLNRTVGNPLLTALINIFYSSRISDSQTGMRAFTRKAVNKIELLSTGMEFASEMIIKAIAHRLVISEVPIAYYKRKTPSKLSPIRDAWRHIQAIIHYSPTYIIILPGALITCIGFFGIGLLVRGPFYFGSSYMIDIHTLTLSVFASILGTHIMLIGIIMRIYTVQILHIPGGWLTHWLLDNMTPDRLAILGLAQSCFGLLYMLTITFFWIQSGFSSLSRERELIVMSGLTITGIEIVFSSFLMGILKQSLRK